MLISDVLRGKPDQAVVTIAPDALVRDLLALLAEHNIGAVVVSPDGRAIAGIVSERDVVRRLHADATTLDGPVSAIMTANVQTCEPSTPVDELAALMTRHRIRHVPVVDGDQLAGIASIGDVVRHRIDELQFERDQLDHYVHQT